MVSWLRGTKLRFKLEYSCHRPPLESVFLNLVISETIQWKLSRPRLFRDSNFLFLRDRDFSRLQIFKSLETETFPRLQFRVFRDRDFPRLGKSCRDRDFFETLADLWSANKFGKLYFIPYIIVMTDSRWFYLDLSEAKLLFIEAPCIVSTQFNFDIIMSL